MVKKPALTDEDQEDQSYALTRYRELVAAQKIKKRLRPTEPEIYHFNIYKK